MRSLSLRATARVPLFPSFGEFLEGRRSAYRARGLPADLGARLGRLAAGEAVEHLLEQLRRQVLVGVLEDLDHRCVGACAETLDLLPGEVAVGGQMMRIVIDAPLAHLDQRL